jgi:hypothetical protein
MNTATLPLIGIVAGVAAMYYMIAPHKCKTPAETTIARLSYVVIVIGFAVYMLFFTTPPVIR